MESFVFLGFGADAWITIVAVLALAANIFIVNIVYPLTPLS